DSLELVQVGGCGDGIESLGTHAGDLVRVQWSHLDRVVLLVGRGHVLETSTEIRRRPRWARQEHRRVYGARSTWCVRYPPKPLIAVAEAQMQTAAGVARLRLSAPP